MKGNTKLAAVSENELQGHVYLKKPWAVNGYGEDRALMRGLFFDRG